MSAALVAKCAGCSADVSFSNGALVVVCDFCKSVVARGDRDLENLGKVVDLVDTGSPLEVGLRGSWRGAPFELHGRAQIAHAAGGVWDEWYAAFDDGRWGWLAEAQGKLYLTFALDLEGGAAALPAWDEVQVGAPLPGFPGANVMVAAEKGRGRYVSARGNVPYRLVPNAEFPFVDASGPDGAFATIDYSGAPPAVYAGREVTLAELGFAHLAAADGEGAKRIKGDRLSCPECDGTLQLAAPDRAQRIACQYCGALLDCSQGRLAKLQLLGKPRKLGLPLGTKGTIDGVTYAVIGYVERSVSFGGVKYHWDEYLLHERAVGFRWLVCSDQQWSFVTPVAAGDVGDNGTSTVRWGGTTFKLFQDTTATVEYVLGEFYWKVAPGERVQAADYIAPPRMLSRELSDDELNWSASQYKTVAEVERAFGVADLPRGDKVAPNQPYPHTPIFRWWGIFVAAALALVLGLSCAPGKQVLTRQFMLDAPTAEGTQVVFTEPFALAARKNVAITIGTDVDNSWAYVEGNLIEEQSGFVQSFALPIEYYHGVSGGESYSEGGPTRRIVVSAPPAGQYVLRLEAQWDRTAEVPMVMGPSPKRVPSFITVTVKQGVPRPWRALWLLGLLSVIPVSVFFHQRSFEKARWADSDYSPYAGGDDE